MSRSTNKQRTPDIPTSSGILPSSVNTNEIANDAVTFDKVQNIATARILGRITASSGNIEELTQSQILTFLNISAPQTFNIEYIVIGGGGNGYGTSGGGAGGYRSSVNGEMSGGNLPNEAPILSNYGILYTITVGAGGGNNSSLISQYNKIVSAGGATYGQSIGGSGSGTIGSGSSRAGGLPVWGQGNQGGYGDGSSTSQQYGGGGGGAGGSARFGSRGTPSEGGNGITSSITGTAIARGGGGGGCAEGNGTANSGGGEGGNIGGNGTANTGGGGGGRTAGNPTGLGGSGVVILRVLSSINIATTTGSPVISTSGIYRIYTFNNSGTIIWNL